MKTIILKTKPETITEIIIDSALKETLSAYFAKNNYDKIICITDETTAHFAKQYLSVKHEDMFVLKPGEQEKNFDNLQKILQFFFEKNIDKHSLVVGIGGGMITDITGFAASIYYRGIPVVFIPTSLLAQVDASIGGKNTVNMNAVKNVLGTIYQPKAIFVDVDFLHTLPPRQFATGMAEIIRYAVGFDTNLLEKLEKNTAQDATFLIDIIAASIHIKTSIVEKDPDESKGLRSLINLGHTLGHALESQTDFHLTHGEAVAIGIHFAAFISHKLNNISSDDVNRITNVLKKYNLPTFVKFDPDKTLEKMRYDKKKTGDEIQYVVLKKIGEACTIPLSFVKLKEYLTEFLIFNF